MTQHYYPATTSDGQEVMILTGWDRRIGGFFLQVEVPAAEYDRYLYASHADPQLLSNAGFSDDMEYFVRVLPNYGLTLPSKIIEAVQADCDLNAGNSCHWYDRDGLVIHQS